MGLYKEVDYWLRERAEKQVRIYPDACDAGLKVESHTSPLAKEFTALFNPSTDEEKRDHEFLIGGLKLHRSVFNYGTMHGSEIVLYLPWEQAELGGNVGTEVFRCTKWTIRYTDDKQKKVKFISLDAGEAMMGEREIWGD